jgi:hypothetical protein
MFGEWFSPAGRKGTRTRKIQMGCRAFVVVASFGIAAMPRFDIRSANKEKKHAE